MRVRRFLIAVFLIGSFMGCATLPHESCVKAGGNWVPQHRECEYMDSKWCTQQQGQYEECASACRHDQEAMMCTMQCVPVCTV